MQAKIEDLGGLLRRLRVCHGLTQEELAERVPEGLSVDTVSNIERGRVRPRRHTLLALLDVLGPDDADRRAALEAWRQQPQEAAASGAPRSSLPSPATPLIGRDRDLAVLERLIGTATVRMVTLTGPGGVGKTRLALAAAAAAEPAFADGAAFVDVTAVRDPDRLLDAIALGLGLADMGDLTAEERLTTYLRPRHLLLILDNCESVVEAGSQLARVIDRCPLLTVLATSREALRIRCEQEYRVAPLELPSPDEIADPVSLELVPAVNLFSRRARMVAPDFTVTGQNAATAAQICRRLDGLPLAIELAAARMRHFGVDTLLLRLENALSVLVGGPRDLPERQRTLRSTLDWSYGLLTAAEQKVLRRLSVFVDGFSEPGAESVCALDAEDLEGSAFGDLLATLLDKSLLRLSPAASGAAPNEPRYGMLETIREYAQGQLREAGEEGVVRDRHARLFCELAESSFAPMYSAARGGWIETLTAESGNMDAALSWCLAGNGDGEIGVRLAGALCRFRYFTGRLNQGRDWLALALDCAAGRRPSPHRARALYAAGKLAWAQGDYEAAVQHAEASLELVSQFEDERARAETLILLGYTRMAVGRAEEALLALKESRSVFETDGDTWQVAFTAVLMAEPLAFLGDFDAAARTLDDALTLFRRVGDRWGEAVAYGMTANASWRRGDHDALEHQLAHACAIFRSIDEKYGLSRMLILRAYLGLTRDDRDKAAQLFREGLSVARELGQMAYSLVIVGGCAAIALLAGREVEAAKLYGRAAPLLETEAPHVDGGAEAARAMYARFLPLLRGRLDERTFDTAWTEGTAMPLDDALDLAHSVLHDPDAPR